MKDRLLIFDLPCGDVSIVPIEVGEFVRDGGSCICVTICMEHHKTYLVGFTSEGSRILMERDLWDIRTSIEITRAYTNIKWKETAVQIEKAKFTFKKAPSLKAYEKVIAKL